MIIVDLQGVMISNLLVSIGNHTNIEIEEGLLRHMILNTIRSNYSRLKNEYGELVVACDGKDYWRRDVFPFYKANRKKIRDQSELDWKKIFEILNKIRDELKEYFPYRVILIDKAEADDIIATLVKKYHESELIMILSSDKDFIQLQKYNKPFFENVRQYDPTRKKEIIHNDPDKYLKEHIIRGDSGDGIPNILSADNTFVIGDRQKKIMTKKLEGWIQSDPLDFCDPNMLRNYKRNQELIDFSYIPKNLEEAIIQDFESQKDKKAKNLFEYFAVNKLKNLMVNINEFI